MPHVPSPQKTRPLLRRPGFWILLFALVACGFLLVGSLLRPWRMLQTFPLEGAGWQPGVPVWEAGPLVGRSRFGAVTVESLGLVVTPPALLGLGAFPELTMENVVVDLENPTAGRELARERLHPDRFPVRQIRLTEVAVAVPSGDGTTRLRVDAEARRNPAGNLEATGRLEGGGVRGSFFARLGWDALEDVVSFRGHVRRDRLPALFTGPGPPLQSALQTRPEEALPVEATLYLDPEWHFAEAVLLLGNAPGFPPLAGVVEGRAGGNLSYRMGWTYERGGEGAGRAFLRGSSGGPVSLRIDAGPDQPVWHLDAPHGWREGAPVRLSGEEALWEGVLREGDRAGWLFLGWGPPPFTVPVPVWPPFLEVRPRTS